MLLKLATSSVPRYKENDAIMSGYSGFRFEKDRESKYRTMTIGERGEYSYLPMLRMLK